MTDGEQVAEEISAVVDSLTDFNCSKEQIVEIYDWYCDVHAEGEEEMQKTLHNCIGIAESIFKENDPQKIAAKRFIDDLVDIAKADGVIKDSEKAWLANFCKMLEIEEPNIEQGIESCQKNNPEVLVIVFYFLHEGAHVKTDINNDLKPALEKSNLKTVCITKHLGTDEKMIDLIIERAKEVENAN